MNALSYRELLESKFHFSHAIGIDVPVEAMNPALTPMTRDIARWALLKGRAAIFANFGLHKTVTQLELMRLLGTHVEGPRLIVLPLGVRGEFADDAAQYFTGAARITTRFIRRPEEIEDDRAIYLTNYETVRDGKLDPNLFGAASLDEASVLRSFGSKTYQNFLTLFDQVPFRFVATATPSPNRYKELIHYAGFLGVMDTGQALTRFFQRDSTQANNLTLYPHMEAEFFAWLHSWALFIQRPSDLGYSDEGYALPPLDVVYHEVAGTSPIGKVDRDGQGRLVSDASLSLKDAADEKRESIPQRMAMMETIVREERAAGAAQVVVWCDLNAEQDAIEASLEGMGLVTASVYGTLKDEEAERRVRAFKQGTADALVAKPVMLGSGVNLQRCHTAVFAGITYKFNDFIQAIHRMQRYGQAHPVRVHVIYTDAEREVLKVLQAKWAEDTALRERMSALIREHGLGSAGIEQTLSRTIDIERRVVRGESFELVNNDSVDEYARIEDNRFGMILTSVPFGNHYEYSASYRDFGHNADNAAFFRQMDHLTPQLLRTLQPGRVLAVHTKDRIRFGNVTGDGFPTVDPFHADCIQHYRRHGFRYFGMITVVTDVVRENNQTYRLGYTEQCKDGTKMGVGSPEYVLLFRKLPTDTSKGYADVRVAKSKEEYSLAQWQVDAHALWRSSGNRLLTAEELMHYGPDVIGRFYQEYSRTNVYDYEEHLRLGKSLQDRRALPSTFMCLAPAAPPHVDEWVWSDVTRMRTLNGEQTRKGLQNHICPLQFDIVDRLITRYTNAGEEVSDPFGGIFTLPTRAVKLGRRGHAVELNPAYFDDGVQYPRAEEEQRTRPTLFDLMNAEDAA
jgi:DNA modification methylase